MQLGKIFNSTQNYFFTKKKVLKTLIKKTWAPILTKKKGLQGIID